MPMTTETEQALILIVDDAVANVEILRVAVRGMAELIFATDGRRAIALVRERRPDLVLLDIEMPGMDGYAVAKAIRAEPAGAEIAVIFVTGHDPAVHELQALLHGAVDFLSKPINIPVARARVRTHLALRMRSRELAQARDELALLLRYLPAFVSHWDGDLINRYCNDRDGNWFGIAAQDMLGLTPSQVLGQAHGQLLARALAEHVPAHLSRFELALGPLSDGRYGEALLARRGDNGLLMVVTDISARKCAEIALLNEKERIRVMLESIGDAVIACDTHGIVTYLNPIAETMTGWNCVQAIGRPIERVMPLHDAADGGTVTNPVRHALTENRIVGMALNCVLQSRDGRQTNVEDSAAPLRDTDGKVTGAIIVFHDVSEARAMAIKMTHLAHHDALTSLPNRILLQDRTIQALHQAERNSRRVAMILLDLDHFKDINDVVGHAAGDQLLQQLGARLQTAIRPTDTVSRQGGDEFIVLLSDLADSEFASVVARKLLALVAEPFEVGEHKLALTASVGISVYPDDAHNQEELFRHADAAMYRSKQDGRHRYRYFSPEIEQRMLARHALERQLRDAVLEGQFEVHYQPKIDTISQRIVGAEALVRMRSTGDLVAPGAFIALAEHTGLIVAIDKLVLDCACRDARALSSLAPDFRISVNVSGNFFNDGSLFASVERALTASGLRPDMLELELTEGVLMSSAGAALEQLTILRALGIRIAVDDFGTGYSSLAYLKRFPLDVLKIDQAFVRELLTEKGDQAIILAILGLSLSLGLSVVAEGVETAGQAAWLAANNCDLMQGYWYGKPVPLAQFRQVLVNQLASAAPAGDANCR
jgi:diguanylate cyclase (GGDEF)-like protein/PAS domain S-box-containing protein